MVRVALEASICVAHECQVLVVGCSACIRCRHLWYVVVILDGKVACISDGLECGNKGSLDGANGVEVDALKERVLSNLLCASIETQAMLRRA